MQEKVTVNLYGPKVNVDQYIEKSEKLEKTEKKEKKRENKPKTRTMTASRMSVRSTEKSVDADSKLHQWQ